jgi:sugar phosphate isomerase/epimerase
MLLSSVNSDYNNDIHSWDEIERQVRNIGKAGFSHMQWIHDWDGEYMYSKSEIYAVKALLEEVGVKAHTVHSTEGGTRAKKVDGKLVFDNRYRLKEIRKDYTSVTESTRLAGVDLLKNRIDLCNAIGATAMVLHMQLPYKMFEESPDDKELYFKQVYKSFDELESYAKNAGVKIALENLICTPMHHQEEQFDRMFDRYSPDFLGFCYDSGHASLMCQDNYYHFLEKYVDRLYATHLQDTDSIPRELLDDDTAVLKHDAHRVPFSGVVDWDIVAKYVAKAPLDLPADFEVGIVGSTPEEEFELLVDCRKKAEKFYEMVLSYK